MKKNNNVSHFLSIPFGDAHPDQVKVIFLVQTNQKFRDNMFLGNRANWASDLKG